MALNSGAYNFVLRMMPAVGPLLGAAFNATFSIRFLNGRVSREYIASRRPFIGVLWHEHVLMALNCVRGRRIVLMSSDSRDGEMSTRYLRRLGHVVVRGSSSAHGARALRQLTHALRQGYAAVLVPDGPHGPPHVAKLGCVIAARDSGAPLIPIGCAMTPSVRLRNWDRTAIPYPFARVIIAYGEPIPVPASTTRSGCEKIRAWLDVAMTALDEQCRGALQR